MGIIYNGQFLGLADSKWSGVLGAFAACVGIDGHSTPGLLKVRQKLVREDENLIDDLCRVRLSTSTNLSLWFGYNNGKIWIRDGGSYTLVYTASPSTGNVGILGADEYDGYIYFATELWLHRIPLASATTTAADWTSDVEDDFGEFAIGDDRYHPMQKQNLQLFIGDGNYVAKVENETASPTHTFEPGGTTTLDILSPLRIKTLIDFDIDILLGTVTSDNVNKAQIYRWDTESESYSTSDPIDENGINCFIRDDNYVYAQCGQFGKIYLYDGQQLVPFKRIPGNWTPSNRAEIYPQAVSSLLTVPVFGLSVISN